MRDCSYLQSPAKENIVRLLQFQDLPVVPWRNGGGVTREVAAFRGPDDEFLWRLSIATVKADGPFSRFDRIDRTIAILAGRGIELQVPDRTVLVTDDTEPFSFTGEEPVHARVLDGDTLDLNAMTRRGHFTHTMRRLRPDAPMSIRCVADATILVFGGRTVVEGPDKDFEAGAFDALTEIAPEEPILIRPDTGAPAYLIEFFRVPA